MVNGKSPAVPPKVPRATNPIQFGKDFRNREVVLAVKRRGIQSSRRNSMYKRYFWLAVGAGILLWVWWSVGRGHSSQTAPSGRSGAGPGTVPVVAGTVEQKDVPIYLDGLGTVQAFNTVMVRTRVDGELTQVLFKEGQEVKTGDLLAVVDPRPFQAALDQAIAKKAQDEAQLGNAQVVLARNTDLLQRKVIDQQTYDTSKFAVDQFKGTVAADQAAIDNARTQLDYTQIKSPIDGRAGIRLVDVGNVVHAADTSGIVILTQLKPISVVFTLPEQDLQRVAQSERRCGWPVGDALDRGNTAAPWQRHARGNRQRNRSDHWHRKTEGNFP